MDVWGNEDMEQEHCSTCGAPVWQNVHGEIDYIRTAPKVKPLLWEKLDEDSYEATDTFGLYELYAPNGWMVYLEDELIIKESSTGIQEGGLEGDDFGFRTKKEALIALDLYRTNRILSLIE